MLHMGVDADTGRIVASTLTPKDVDDASQTGPLLDQVAEPLASFTGDGAYDQDRVYASVAERHPEAAVVVPPRASAVPSDTAETAPTQRDGHLQHIAEHGRMAWQNASGYNKRARVEAAMNRWKQVIGDELRAHTDQRRATEVAVAVHALNRMLELERPSTIRVARPSTTSDGDGVSAPIPLIPAPRCHTSPSSWCCISWCLFWSWPTGHGACRFGSREPSQSQSSCWRRSRCCHSSRGA